MDNSINLYKYSIRYIRYSNWYIRAYSRPFNHLRYRPYFRPHRYDYRFAPGSYRGFNRPNNKFHNRKPDIIPNRPSQNNRNRVDRIPNRTPNRIPNRTPNRSGHFGNGCR